MFNPCTVQIKHVLEGICEDCGKEIMSNTEDSNAFFDNHLCSACEAEMFRNMVEAADFSPAHANTY